MTHVSLSLRQKRTHLHRLEPLSLVRSLWLTITGRVKRLPRKLRRSVAGRSRQRRYGKQRLDQLTDHELKDIGLTRDHPTLGQHHQHWVSPCSESEQLHRGLRDLQYDLLRRLPRD